MISTVEVLKLMEAFVNEPNYTVWSDLSCNLGVLSSLLSHTDFHEEIQEFIRDLFTPIGLKLGWECKQGEGEPPGAGGKRYELSCRVIPSQSSAFSPKSLDVALIGLGRCKRDCNRSMLHS